MTLQKQDGVSKCMQVPIILLPESTSEAADVKQSLAYGKLRDLFPFRLKDHTMTTRKEENTKQSMLTQRDKRTHPSLPCKNCLMKTVNPRFW